MREYIVTPRRRVRIIVAGFLSFFSSFFERGMKEASIVVSLTFRRYFGGRLGFIPVS